MDLLPKSAETDTVEFDAREVFDFFVKHNRHHRISTLSCACKIGDMRMVKILVCNKIVGVNEKDKDGFTALIWASNLGQANIVELLLKYGANIDAKNKWGITALMTASWNGNEEIVEILLKHDVDMNAIDRRGRTALMCTYPNIVELLLKHGANINVKDRRGRTALMWNLGCIEIVELLLKYGAIIDDEGMAYARYVGGENIMKILLEHRNKK